MGSSFFLAERYEDPIARKMPAQCKTESGYVKIHTFELPRKKE